MIDFPIHPIPPIRLGFKLFDGRFRDPENWSFPKPKWDSGKIALRACLGDSLTLNPCKQAQIPTGVGFEIPNDHCMIITPDQRFTADIAVLVTPVSLTGHQINRTSIHLQVYKLPIGLDEPPAVIHPGQIIAWGTLVSTPRCELIEQSAIAANNDENDAEEAA